MLIEQLLQVDGRGSVGGAEVEGAVAGVALCTGEATGDGRPSNKSDRRRARLVLVSPCSSTMGFLSASACLISSWQ